MIIIDWLFDMCKALECDWPFWRGVVVLLFSVSFPTLLAGLVALIAFIIKEHKNGN